MRFRAFFVLVVAAACAGGCTPGSVPATAPSTIAPEEGAPSSTMTSTTTVPPETTTTVDRITEIAAIFEDLERRRLAAIYSGDVEAFTALFADTPYLDRSLAVFDIVEPGEPPAISIEVLEVLRDDAECLAIYYEAMVGREVAAPATAVLDPASSTLAYLYTSDGRDTWLCDGPHPLSE